MKKFKGTVRNNVVVLENGIQLPEGTAVEVRLRDRQRKRSEAIKRLLANQITRPVGMAELLEEDKKERDEYWPF